MKSNAALFLLPVAAAKSRHSLLRARREETDQVDAAFNPNWLNFQDVPKKASAVNEPELQQNPFFGVSEGTAETLQPQAEKGDTFFSVNEEQSLNQNSFEVGNSGDIQFTYLSANELVLQYLRDPNGLVEFRNIQSSSHPCFALFSNGHSAGVHNTTGKNLIPDSGIMLSSGNPEDFNGQDSDEATTNWKVTDPDEELSSVLPGGEVITGGEGAVYDACYLKFEFRCPDETDAFTPKVNFDYVFGSDEYYEYVNSQYNDAFGFFLNGHNIAYLPDGETSVTINNVNHEMNSEYFIGNEMEGRGSLMAPYMTIEADGLTTELTAIAEPKPGWNQIKLVIGDVSDGILDSWVLLEGGTFGCKERTESPSLSPTAQPTTKQPTTRKPTNEPAAAPTKKPTRKPTKNPTASPSLTPTFMPSNDPTGSPSSSPTRKPTKSPTAAPSLSPSYIPTSSPSYVPTESPTYVPTASPTSKPITKPTNKPTHKPVVLALATETPTPKPTPCHHEPTRIPVSAALVPELPTTSPTSSHFPSESPTYPYPCGLIPCDRSKALKEFYSTISDPSLLDIPGTPQSLALDWIINHDLMAVCPNDNTDHITQRYVLAVFYYATEGWQWKSCNAPKDFKCEGQINQANSKCELTVSPDFEETRVGANETNAWLTPSDECSWGGVACHKNEGPKLTSCVFKGTLPKELASLNSKCQIRGIHCHE